MHIAVPDLVSNSYFPVVAALELGFFEDEGIEVDLHHIYPVSQAMEALRDGDLDFVAGAAHTTLLAFPEWEGARLLAAIAQQMYWTLVINAKLEAQIGELQALKGLRIGAAPGPDMILKRMLIEAGVDPKRDKVQIGPVPGSLTAGGSFGIHAARCLEQGIIDGFWANGMATELALRTGCGILISDARRAIGPSGPRDYTFAALVATTDMIWRYPEQVAAAVRALVKAQRALRENPSLATGVGERLFPPMEAALIEGLVEQDSPYYSPDISEMSVREMNKFARSEGLLTASVEYDQVVATEFRSLWA